MRNKELIESLSREQIRDIANYYNRQQKIYSLSISNDIKNFIQDLTGVPDFFIKTRKTDVVFARWLYFYAMRELTELSYRDIAYPFDHSTAINAIKQLKLILKYDKGWRNTQLRKTIIFIKKTQLK